jgi:MFS transporter, PHS family, inorganic phosphate transporter
MLATVFFMQPLGQIAGNVVSLIVIAASRSQGDTDLVRTVDIMWRWVIGIGSIPGVIALLFRIAIPETPRFSLEIDDDPVKAEFDATTLFTGDVPKSPSADERGSWGTGSAGFKIPGIEDGFSAGTEFTIQPATLNAPWRLAKADIVQYFWTEGNWRALLGTSLCWLLVDFGFYGIGLSSPQFLADVWGSLHLSKPAPPWQTDDRPGANLYDQFEATSIHAMIILNVGSVAGGLLLILFVNKIDRTSLQLYGFLLLAALFVALGITFITTQEVGTVAIVLYIFGQMLFNFGTFAFFFPFSFFASSSGNFLFLFFGDNRQYPVTVITNDEKKKKLNGNY